MSTSKPDFVDKTRLFVSATTSNEWYKENFVNVFPLIDVSIAFLQIFSTLSMMIQEHLIHAE
jgi:biopolymer transport protein ExbD